MAKFRGFIGTYTKGDSKGIYSFVLDSESHEVSDIKLAAELRDPTYLTISKDGQFLYSVMKEADAGGISAFSIDAKSGGLTFKSKETTVDGGPCHINVDTAQKQALSANYHSGVITAFSLHEDGSISGVTSTAEHHGSGPNKDRQEKAHAHFAGFTPNEKFAVAVDLGTDEVILYRLEQGKLIHHFTFKATPGSGPRHIAFHPTEPYAYIMTELSNEVIVCQFNEELGELTELQIISTLPDGYEDLSQGSAIHITKDGKHIYVGNRGHDSIASFQINQISGELALVEIINTEGSWPRDFHLDPSERVMLASNQETSNLTVYSRDSDSGKLTLQKSSIDVPYPVCVAFIQEPI
ncbi:lactonase family protein [Shouchella patagoniensis]|uniref:lactonase family protein n=1 Tax=Shouchella patagoniensis TaxID=228576 RepID=UPI0009959733|nr:lactonase family protein [Shouchella patagoniensis]